MSIYGLVNKLQLLNEAKEEKNPFTNDPTNKNAEDEDTNTPEGEGDVDENKPGGDTNDDDMFKDDPTSNHSSNDTGTITDNEPSDDKAEGVPDLEDPGADDQSDPAFGDGESEDTDFPDEGGTGDENDPSEINILNLSPISKALLQENLLNQYNELLDKINTMYNLIDKLTVNDIEYKISIKNELDNIYEKLSTYINNRYLENSYDKNFLNFSVFLNKFNEILGNIDSMYEQSNKKDDSKEKNL